ncbi:hypothetical protein SteCoe_18489 [Stentor coeruleus]|uniref:F5/8 type C domain-containing protein n=1 Tax=Stentor coeruleus TaxID=5963 RepID=A0A1R2BWL5_9CILI|nr:hypothetical protein SteCoe_18489 [Stentor coeruleus]
MSNYINALDESNGASILHCSSEAKGCSAANILNSNEKRLWLTSSGLPQEAIINISNSKSQLNLSVFGWYCWHSYKSNPCQIELYTSSESNSWTKWASFQGKPRSGYNFYQIDPILPSTNYIKILILSTHGASNTYINQVFLLETMPSPDLLNNSRDSIDQYSADIEKSVDKLSTPLRFSPDEGSRISNFPSPEFMPRQYEVKKETTEKFKDMFQIKPSNYTLPKTNEIDKLKKEVEGWGNDIGNIQGMILSLTEQIDRLQNAVENKTCGQMVKEIKQSVMSSVSKNTISPREPDYSIIAQCEEIFNRYMDRWEEQVLRKDLAKVRIGSCENTLVVQELISKLDEKLKYKDKLLKKKEMLQELKRMKFYK